MGALKIKSVFWSYTVTVGDNNEQLQWMKGLLEDEE